VPTGPLSKGRRSLRWSQRYAQGWLAATGVEDGAYDSRVKGRVERFRPLAQLAAHKLRGRTTAIPEP
jgi:hypothetical protein